jgi:TPR repeat protein
VQQAIAWVKSAAKRDDIEAIAQFGMLSLNWELGDTERVKVLVHAATQRDLEVQMQRLARRAAPRTEDGVRTPAN